MAISILINYIIFYKYLHKSRTPKVDGSSLNSKQSRYTVPCYLQNTKMSKAGWDNTNPCWSWCNTYFWSAYDVNATADNERKLIVCLISGMPKCLVSVSFSGPLKWTIKSFMLEIPKQIWKLQVFVYHLSFPEIFSLRWPKIGPEI